LRPAWAAGEEELLALLGADRRGLGAEEAARRRRQWGPNSLRAPRGERALSILGRQFRGWMAGLLAVAASTALLAGEAVDAASIALVLVLNALLGFATELRGVRSMESLARLTPSSARLRRAGADLVVRVDDIVPGDLVVVEGGDLVPADLRLLAASNLQADEAALTGESLPVAKRAGALPESTPLAERANLLFQGTAVTSGAGEGVVVATGMRTELGAISDLAASTRRGRTPLERRLAELGRRLVLAALGASAAALGLGLLAGKTPLLMAELAISLAVAAIPEGLPVVATMALARGAWRMARREAVVRRLSAVETLGTVTLVLTDKTGTLTENRVRVDTLLLASGEVRPAAGLPLDAPLRAALEVAALCSNAALARAPGGGLGDPLERALLEAAGAAGLDREALLDRFPEVREDAFTAERRLMATVHHDGDGGYRVAVKGAAEEVLAAATSWLASAGARPLDLAERRRWHDRAAELAGRGLRVLGLAGKTAATPDVDPYAGLTFIGLVGFADPPRRGVEATLAALRGAGIRLLMVTGDHPETAASVARAVGLVRGGTELPVRTGADLATADPTLLASQLFARVAPDQKLALVSLAQRAGEVVAMLGDGVNDAPALRQADIGVAMGRRGTQVARDAADMVLRDDSLATVAAAVEQGRAIYANLRTFVVYLLSCNLSEILVVFAAAGLAAPLAILPLQILFLNLVTDVFPALALGLSEARPDVMRRPPRPPGEPLLEPRHWRAVAGQGLLLCIAPFAALAAAVGPLELGGDAATSLSFLALAVAQLLHVFAMRGRGSPLLRNEITRNPHVWGALLTCAALLAAALYLPPLARLLRLQPPRGVGWLALAACAATPALLTQALAALARRPAPT
jgi:Ca2+-transporting ATPase